MTPRWPGRGRDAGSTTLEVVVLTPVLLLMLTVLVAAGRLAMAGQGVQLAADQAARSASIARTSTDARSEAVTLATATLAQQSLACTSLTVAVDTSGFGLPVGTPATVSATVTCLVPLGDLALPGVPGTRSVTATAASPLDTYRERT